ncbi:MAG: FAD-dependent oxidoreductase, partial [Bacteroidetes bacterium]|nr:FAD-dependent oxidoreductase [Bacteroidota bacterium]
MRAQRIAVIGGVAAGPAAAVQARRTDPDAEIVMFEQGSNISYSACEMLMLVSGEIDDPEQLIHRSPKDFQRERGIEVRAETRVDRIDPRAGKLVCTSGDTGVTSEEDFDKFILATGARASVPDIDGADAENVFVLRRLGDAIELRGFISTETIHHAVVVGAGFVGLEVVEALVKNGIRVSLLEPGPGPMHAHLHEELSTLVGRL